MQRRSFFGVLGGVAAFLGLTKSALPAIDTDLPIVRTEGIEIVNLDELFRNAPIHQGWFPSDPLGYRRLQVVKVYLPLEDGLRLFARDCQYYGPVYLRRMTYEKHVEVYYHFHRAKESMDIPETLQKRSPLGMHCSVNESIPDILKDYLPKDFTTHQIV